MTGLRRICIAVFVLSSLIWIRNRLAGLTYQQHNAAYAMPQKGRPAFSYDLPLAVKEPVFEVAPHANGETSGTGTDSPSTTPQDPADAQKEDPFGSLFKSIVKSLVDGNTSTIERVPFSGQKGDKIVVMGRLRNESTDWVEAELPDWQHAIYTVDDSTAPLHTSENKGKEANAYLTYIIENYDNLPSLMAFIHSHHDGPHAWHVDAPHKDNGRALQMLNLDFVRKNGYANLRCLETPGCPMEIQPLRKSENLPTEVAFADAWQAIFNDTVVPLAVATACCAQFAVSREQVLQRSREEYVWYLQWLMETSLEDDVSGRVFEYLWHIIFGRSAVYCPPVEQCYKDVYGVG